MLNPISKNISTAMFDHLSAGNISLLSNFPINKGSMSNKGENNLENVTSPTNGTDISVPSEPIYITIYSRGLDDNRPLLRCRIKA